MASTRRLGALSSETRALLIDAAAHILKDQGAAAVTARHLAEKIGLQRHIIHYYFGTIEDLFVAILQRDSARTREWLEKALVTEKPLDIIWAMGCRAAAVTLEFSVLATRSDAIREQFKASSEEFRVHLARALEKHFQAIGVTTKFPPVVITLALQSLAYTITIENLLGITDGHAVMEKHLKDLISTLVASAASQG